MIFGNEYFWHFPINWIPNGKVSKYFYDAFMKIWTRGMENEFLQLKKKHPDYEIWVNFDFIEKKIKFLANRSFIEWINDCFSLIVHCRQKLLYF